MTKDLLPIEISPARYPDKPRGRRVHLSTTIALVVLFALSVIAVSIGIAQADTLTAMVDDEAGRLALFGLVALIAFVGAFTAMMMRVTAPAPARVRKLTRI
jgi:hypothetical protein